MWSRKMNVASVLYILARVCGPLYYLSTIVLLGYVDDTVWSTPRLRLRVLVADELFADVRSSAVRRSRVSDIHFQM